MIKKMAEYRAIIKLSSQTVCSRLDLTCSAGLSLHHTAPLHHNSLHHRQRSVTEACLTYRTEVQNTIRERHTHTDPETSRRVESGVANPANSTPSSGTGSSGVIEVAE